MAANGRGHIDVLLISIGANDVGFGDAVIKCADYASLWDTDCTTDSTLKAEITNGLGALNDRYDQLATALQSTFPHAIGRTYLTQYHDPLHTGGGTVCDRLPVGDQLDRVSGVEAQWLFDTLLTPLNSKVFAATQRHASQGWTFVGGIASDFIGHAYCTENRFANTDGDSQANQGDHYGVVHPNFKGYQVFGQHIASTVLNTYHNVSVFVSQDVPASLAPGQQATVTVQMLNVGTLPWVATGGNPYELGSQNPQGTGDINTWGTTRVNLPAEVPVGGTGVFTFPITAPSTPGIYHFQWSMLQAWVEWFGEFTPDTAITVATPPAAPSTLKDTVTPSGALYKHTLSWNLNSTNQTSVVLKYQDDTTTTWNTITMPTATTTQYVLGSAFKLGHGYNINVQACYGSVCSAPSNTIWVDIASTY
jgi:hypothetical protein